MRTSIHIITRDRLPSLAVLLSSLLRQTYKKFDIVILDNSRNTKVLEDFLILALFERFKLEGHRIAVYWIDMPDDKRDIGTLRNKVIELDPFENEIGVRIDDDSLCEKDYIEKLVKGFTSDNIAVVGGIVPYLWHEKVYAPMPEKWNYIPENFVADNWKETGIAWADNCVNFYDADGYFESGHVRSSFAYRIDVAKKVRFEEWIGPTGFGEETVFSVKVQMHGYKVMICPTAVCWHINMSSGAGRDANDYKVNYKERNLINIKKILEEYRQQSNQPIKSYP